MRILRIAALGLLLCLALTACKQNPKTVNYTHYLAWFDTNIGPDTPKEAAMRAAGLVDIHDVDSSIAVQLIYTGPYNFMGRPLYHGFTKAFMLPELAEKLVLQPRN